MVLSRWVIPQIVPKKLHLRQESTTISLVAGVEKLFLYHVILHFIQKKETETQNVKGARLQV